MKLAGALLTVSVVAFLVLVTVDVLATRTAAQQASERGRDAIDQVSAGELESAVGTLHLAGASLIEVTRRLDRPWMRVARHLPWIGDDLEAAWAGAGAGTELSAAASGVFGILASTPTPLFHAGRFDQQALAGLGDTLASAETHVAASQRFLGAAPRPHVAVVRDAIEELRQVSGIAYTTLGAATSLANRLSGPAPFRMLILIENGAEQRATGGIIGFVALLQIDEGVLRLARVDVVHKLRVLDDQGNYVQVEAPADYLVRYGSFLANTSLWLNVNLSPDFPTVAKVASRLYEKATGIHPDAVARVDLTGIGYLLDGFGPVTVDGRPIDPSTLATDFIVDSYLRYPDPQDQTDYLARAVTEVFTQVFATSNVDGRALATGLERAVAERRLAVVTGDAAIDEGLEAVHANGAILPGDPGDLDVVVQNFAANKIDLFTRERIDVDVTAAGCAVVGTVSVTITNDAPDWAAGLPTEDASLEGRWWVNVYLPARATVVSVTENGVAVPATQGTEAGRPVVARLTTIGTGDHSIVAVRYQEVSSGADYRVRIEPQPLVHPATLSFGGSEPIVMATIATHAYTTNCDE